MDTELILGTRPNEDCFGPAFYLYGWKFYRPSGRRTYLGLMPLVITLTINRSIWSIRFPFVFVTWIP